MRHLLGTSTTCSSVIRDVEASVRICKASSSAALRRRLGMRERRELLTLENENAALVNVQGEGRYISVRVSASDVVRGQGIHFTLARSVCQSVMNPSVAEGLTGSGP